MALHTTPRLALRYPDLAQAADLAFLLQTLADDVDSFCAGYSEGVTGARPAAGRAGWFYLDTTTEILYIDDGATWQPVGAVANGSITYAKIADALKPSVAAIASDEALRALGTTASTAAAGNDARLSNARTPTAHAASHEQGGSDELSHLAVNALPIYETGVLNQLRAGRVLALVDFTTLLGLNAPQGLWNLGNLIDISGNGGNLTNKGAVTFGLGITGNTPEAAIFHGGATDSLYIHSNIYDLGGYGSWSCWFQTCKKGTTQTLISKYKAAQRGWYMEIINDVVETGVNLSGAANGALTSVDGKTIVTDGKWHHACGVYDGTTLSLYVDFVLEAQIAGSGPFFQTTTNSDLNIGSDSADAGTNASNPFFGKIDEAFATPDIISEDQIRMLGALKIAHGFPVVPNGIRLNVRRRRRGGTLGITPFSAQPLHLYDFTAGALTDAGSLNNALTNNNAAVAAPGADGAQGNAFNFVAALNQYLSATDVGLPAGVTTRTLGCWFKTGLNSQQSIIAYGTNAGGKIWLEIGSGGQLIVDDGVTSYITPIGVSYLDGQLHFVVVTYDNAAADGLRFKMYVDGKLAFSSTTALNPTTLAGANAFRIGASLAGASFFNGSLDGIFITNYAATSDEVAKWYAQGSLDMPASPKNPGDHIEGVDATNIYAIFDTLESQHKIDLLVSA